MVFSGFEGKSERAISIISNTQKGTYQARNEDAGIKDLFLVAGTAEHELGAFAYVLQAEREGQPNSDIFLAQSSTHLRELAVLAIDEFPVEYFV
jgi:hypothetical protein